MFVSVYLCICACIYIWTMHIHICIRVHVRVHVYAYAYMQEYVKINKLINRSISTHPRLASIGEHPARKSSRARNFQQILTQIFYKTSKLHNTTWLLAQCIHFFSKLLQHFNNHRRKKTEDRQKYRRYKRGSWKWQEKICNSKGPDERGRQVGNTKHRKRYINR